MLQHVRFVKRTTTELLRNPAFQHLVTAEPVMVAETVRLPPLLTGQHMFPHFQTIEEVPPELHWHSPDYGSVQPWHLRFREPLVHGEAGIVCIGDAVVSDTLQQTAPGLQHYRDSHDAIGLAVDRVAALPGRWLSLLGGNYGNYYHWTLEGLGRLATVEIDGLAVDGILLPAQLTAVQQDGIALTGITQGRPVRGVAPAEQVRPAQLLAPWSMTGFHRPHPMLRPFFARMRDAVAVEAQATPPLIYIDRRPADRRAAAHRRLLNEDEIVAGLARLGFVAVVLEHLSLAEQVRLFAGAAVIVAPHGAGLANIVYTNPGCRLIELHIDGWINWCFRTLSAVCGVAYDAVPGRLLADTTPTATRRWIISETHVMAAVARVMDG